MSEQIAAIFILAGLVVLAAGLLWATLRCLGVVLRRRSVRRLLVPLALAGAGLIVGLTPFVAQQAYLAEQEGAKAFREILGLEARLFTVDNTQAWLGVDETNVVVAFRGTESATTLDGLKDILLTDAMNLLVVPEGRLGHDLSAAGVGARFHKGFVDAIAEVWEPLAAAVEAELKANDRPLWITGHSLGGALALLAAWLLKRRFVLVHEVCTFGAQMIGNREACAAFDREFAGRIFRYVNGRDPVPKLPTLSLVVFVRRGPRRYGSDSMRRSGVLKAICRCGFSSYNRFKRAFELTV